MDPIAQLITSLKNASMAGKPELKVSSSRFKQEIVSKLAEVGVISSFKEEKERGRNYLAVSLRQLHDIKRISKPSRRVYLKAKLIPLYRAKRSRLLLSTPKGVLFDYQAKKANVGGEVILEVS